MMTVCITKTVAPLKSKIMEKIDFIKVVHPVIRQIIKASNKEPWGWVIEKSVLKVAKLYERSSFHPKMLQDGGTSQEIEVYTQEEKKQAKETIFERVHMSDKVKNSYYGYVQRTKNNYA